MNSDSPMRDSDCNWSKSLVIFRWRYTLQKKNSLQILLTLLKNSHLETKRNNKGKPESDRASEQASKRRLGLRLRLPLSRGGWEIGDHRFVSALKWGNQQFLIGFGNTEKVDEIWENQRIGLTNGVAEVDLRSNKKTQTIRRSNHPRNLIVSVWIWMTDSYVGMTIKFNVRNGNQNVNSNATTWEFLDW
jgi:hypothetical protein